MKRELNHVTSGFIHNSVCEIDEPSSSTSSTSLEPSEIGNPSSGEFGELITQFLVDNENSTLVEALGSLALSSDLQVTPRSFEYDNTSLDFARSTRSQLVEAVKLFLSKVEVFELEHNSKQSGIEGLYEELRGSTTKLTSGLSRIEKLEVFADCIS